VPTRVRFRFNKVTGEVEEFVVDDQDRTLPEAEHDRIAAAVGAVVAVSPRILEVLSGSPAPATAATPAGGEPEAEGDEKPEAPRREGT
jgi:FtsH ternary system domain X3